MTKTIAILALLALAGCYTATAPNGRRFTCVEEVRTEYPPLPGTTKLSIADPPATDEAVATKGTATKTPAAK